MKIGLIGLGGGGSNTVSAIYREFLPQNGFGMEFAIVNTDIQAIKKIEKEFPSDKKEKDLKKIIIGSKLLSGLGAGAEPEKGYLAALETQEKIREFVAGKNILFLAVGFGGGTGSGAVPVTLKIAREEGCLPIVFGTFPWSFEGESRKINAYHSYNSVMNQKGNGAVIIVNNNVKFEGTMKDLFKKCDSFLKKSILSILSLLYDREATINIDFNDIRTALKENSTTLFFFEKLDGFRGSAEEDSELHNEHLAKDLAYALVTKDIGTKMEQPGNLVINISGSEEILSMKMVEVIMSSINTKLRKFKSDREVQTIFGVTFNPKLGSKISISGFITHVTYVDIEAGNKYPSIEEAYPEVAKVEALAKGGSVEE